MIESNPLTETVTGDPEDQLLVKQVQEGNREALERLIKRHQGWVYNIVLRMMYLPHDAEDTTQEILIKLITKLSTFQGKSSFRTWLYRIVVNHVLNMQRGRAEAVGWNFTAYGRGLDSAEDAELPDPNSVPADVRLLVDEARIGCTSGMLLCLDREQRLIYILGEIFEVTDAVGAELLEISRENFRQRLARARRELHNFMNNKCGLVNPANPCRCAKKTRGFIEAGYVDPARLLFAGARLRQVEDVRRAKTEALATLDQQCGEIFRRHPFYEAADLVPAIRRL